MNRSNIQNRSRGGSNRNSRNSSVRANNNVRLNHMSNAVNKTEPFLVRRNRQLVSLPAHKESGLNIERVFRLRVVRTATNSVLVTVTDICSMIANELGVDVAALASKGFQFTIKEVRIYSGGTISGAGYYSVNRYGMADDKSSFTFNDVSASAGLSSVEYIYPIQARIVAFVVATDANNVLSLLPQPGEGAASGNTSYYVDWLISVNSTQTAPTALVQN